MASRFLPALTGYDMLIRVRLSTKFRVARVGVVAKEVLCEKCNGQYHYQMIRRGVGTAVGRYDIFADSDTQARADTAARQELEAQFARESDPVACPDCGWIQRPMVDDVRRRSSPWIVQAGWIGFSLMLLGAGVICWDASNAFDHMPDNDALAWAAVYAIVGGCLIPIAGGVRQALAEQFDPNAAYPKPPAPIPGAPTGVRGKPLEQRECEPEADAAELIPASWNIPTALPQQLRRSQPLFVEPGGWVTVQLLNVQYPHRCCVCLRDTNYTHAYRCSKLTVAKVPLCDPCQKAWCKTTAFTHRAAALAGVIVFFGLGPDQAGPLGIAFGAAGGAVLGRLASGLLLRHFRRPAQFSGYDPRLNTIRVRFRNPEFLGLVLTHNASGTSAAAPFPQLAGAA